MDLTGNKDFRELIHDMIFLFSFERKKGRKKGRKEERKKKRMKKKNERKKKRKKTKKKTRKKTKSEQELLNLSSLTNEQKTLTKFLTE